MTSDGTRFFSCVENNYKNYENIAEMVGFINFSVILFDF